MADKTYLAAGDYNTIDYKLAVHLDEGNITVGSAKNVLGSPQVTYSFASELVVGDLVTLVVDDAATFEAGGGSVIVKKATADCLIFGRIISDIVWKSGLHPMTSVTGTLAQRMAAGRYRIATIEVYGGIHKIVKATLKGKNVTKIVPGDVAKLVVDLDNQVAGKFCVKDAANGGAGMIALHAVPLNDGDTYSLLVGITGFPVGDVV